mgnify:CR=1 FL=1
MSREEIEAAATTFRVDRKGSAVQGEHDTVPPPRLCAGQASVTPGHATTWYELFVCARLRLIRRPGLTAADSRACHSGR